MPIAESAPERMQRIAELQGQLLEPETSADAALRLEAIGPEGVDTLLKGVSSKDPEVRFYSAEALAFLDHREAAQPLGEIARDQPAFRVFALSALSTMQQYVAYEQLRDLLSAPSAETRYGAFRSLWSMNPNDPFVKGEYLGRQFHYHVLDVAGPSMIHVTRSRLPEIVVFGPEQRFLTPLAVSAGNQIMVTSSGGNQIAVSKFTVGDCDQKRTVSTQVDEVIRAIVDLGGTYPDVVQALQEAKATGALPSRFEVDALPEAGRTYDRLADAEQDKAEQDGKANKDVGEKEAEEKAKATPSRPAPELSAQRGAAGSRLDRNAGTKTREEPDPDADSSEETAPKKGFFARILGH